MTRTNKKESQYETIMYGEVSVGDVIVCRTRPRKVKDMAPYDRDVPNANEYVWFFFEDGSRASRNINDDVQRWKGETK